MFLTRIAELIPRPYLSLLLGVVTIEGLLLTLYGGERAGAVVLATCFAVAFLFWLGQGTRIYDRLLRQRLLTKPTPSLAVTVSRPLAYLVVLLPLLTWLYWPAGLAMAVVMALIGVRPALAQLRDILRSKRQFQEDVARFLSDPPKIIAYLSGPSDVAYQINQWTSVLERLSVKTAIILRNPGIYAQMKPTTLDVYYARGGREVEWFVNNGPKVVLYPNNREQNVNSLRHYELTHVFINHGESDKSVNQSKMLMAYDHLFVGGAMAEKRLRDVGLPIRDRQIVHVGRPQAEMMLTPRVPDAPVRNILYAPTWEGGVQATDYSSVGPFGLDVLKRIIADGRFKLRLKLHPLTGSSSARARDYRAQIESLCLNSPLCEIAPAGGSIHDAMNWSDLMICDVSAVLGDYLPSEKPIVLCTHFQSAGEDVEKEFPLSAAAYKLSRLTDLDAILEDVTTTDSRLEARKHVRNLALGAQGSFDRFEAALLAAIETNGGKKA